MCEDMPFLIICRLRLLRHKLLCPPPNVWQFFALTLKFVNFSHREICITEMNFSVQFSVETIG